MKSIILLVEKGNLIFYNTYENITLAISLSTVHFNLAVCLIKLLGYDNLHNRTSYFIIRIESLLWFHFRNRVMSHDTKWSTHEFRKWIARIETDRLWQTESNRSTLKYKLQHDEIKKSLNRYHICHTRDACSIVSACSAMYESMVV